MYCSQCGSALEEHFRFALHGFAEVVIEIREDVGVRLQTAQVAQEEPLPGEVAAEGP